MAEAAPGGSAPDPHRLPSHQVAGLYRRDVGAMRVATIHDGMLATAFDDIVDADPARCEAMHRAAHRPMPPTLSCNAFVVETAGRLMLVDAGCGTTAPAAGHHGAGLAALGVAPDAVDAVLMTHLHRDHAAGLVDAAGRALFRNAELVVHADDLAFWQDGRSVARLRDSQKVDHAIAATVLAAYGDRLRPVRAGEVAPGITAVPTPGHTPGHTAWLLQSDGERLLIWGDVVHLPAIQFAEPRASVAYDLDSAAAAATRARVLDMVATERIPVAGVHLDFPCFGHVDARSDGGYAYVPGVWTSDL